MALYLVRHAHAGSRKAWRGDDRERPLDDRGLRQAKGLLAVVPPNLAVVTSSPSTRCVQTVEPLAARAGLGVDADDGLLEGAPPGPIAERLSTLLRTRPGADLVACSHGDVIPELLRLWATDGAALDPTQKTAKGSTWVLEADEEGRIVGGAYVPPTD